MDPIIERFGLEPDVWPSTCSFVCGGGSTRVYGVGDCTRLIPTLSVPQRDLRTTNRPHSWTPARLTTSAPRIKKIIFSPPSKRPIDLFGPVANRTILKQLHDVFRGIRKRTKRVYQVSICAICSKQPTFNLSSASAEDAGKSIIYPIHTVCCTARAITSQHSAIRF